MEQQQIGELTNDAASTVTLTGALAALAFSAATAHADPDAPTPIDAEFNFID